METHISHGIAAVHWEAEGLKHILSGYLPSTGAGAVGMFFGFRKNSEAKSDIGTADWRAAPASLHPSLHTPIKSVRPKVRVLPREPS